MLDLYQEDDFLFEVIMARSEIFFYFCNASRGDILNIYIHGYSAVTNDAEEK
ncbi:hypothetical protein [Pectobacterium versatile]|uniref:hypothetical protein n=1 Tax=Pectobacterium versatile TaxID=2488639 RepID=UPI002B24F45D|nr:hypothetical protein [Pectobacterium versatile]